MKKYFVLILVILLAITAVLFFKYREYQATQRDVQKFNSVYEEYDVETLNGLDVTTMMNKATSNNEKYEIPKDEHGLYILDDQYSIEIYVTMVKDEEPYRMERFSQNDISSFIRLFGEVGFKCVDKTYHDKTGRIATMTFEAEEY